MTVARLDSGAEIAGGTRGGKMVTNEKIRQGRMPLLLEGVRTGGLKFVGAGRGLRVLVMDRECAMDLCRCHVKSWGFVEGEDRDGLALRAEKSATGMSPLLGLPPTRNPSFHA
jgi:hypothetical protein